MTAPLIHAETLACRRGDRILWRRLSFALHAGEALHVTGPNGAGKSSLIRILAGLLRAESGRVERRVKAAMIDEAHALDRELPLERALAFWARLDGNGARDVARALDSLAIAHLARVPLRILSTGQRKRAGLARLIAGGAPVWLLDEPANGLDRDGTTLLEGLISAHRARGGAAVIASHQPLALPGAIPIDITDHRP